MESKIERLHIEQMILSCMINQHLNNELDQLEFREYKLPFELFKANKSNQLCAKAIFNMQEENKPVDDMTILSYIEKFTSINQIEWLELISSTWTTYDTMIIYINHLLEIDKEENKAKRLKAIR